MQIHELALLTGIHPETIRSYRLKGLIHPAQKENGYYDYTMENIIELAYIRKLREYEVPIQSIQKIFSDNSTSDTISILREEIQDLEQQIETLHKRLRFLEMERSHVEESMQIYHEKVSIMDSVDEKIDFYTIDTSLATQLKPSSAFYLTQTPVICIAKDILNGPIEDRIIPIKAGIGTYRFMLEERNIPVPSSAAIIPNGTFLSMMVTITDLEHMNLLQIEPLMRYAKDHHLTFLSDTTGYLARIELKDNRPCYHFRIRACIEIKPRTRKTEKAMQAD